LNDLKVTENCVKITGLARKLGHLEAEARKGKTLAFFIALSDIELAAKKAQERLNEIDYGPEFKAPEEQMGS
jgi:hypothetical protein